MKCRLSRRGFLAAAAGATLVSRSLPAWASDKMKQVAFGLGQGREAQRHRWLGELEALGTERPFRSRLGKDRTGVRSCLHSQQVQRRLHGRREAPRCPGLQVSILADPRILAITSARRIILRILNESMKNA